MAKRFSAEDSSLDPRHPKRRIPLEFDHGYIARPSAQDGDSSGGSSECSFASGAPFFSNQNSVNYRTSSPTTPAPTDEVCFGMICRIKTQLLDDPSIANVNLDIHEATDKHHEMRILMERIHLLQTKDGKDIAVLNTQASKAFQTMENLYTVRYKVFVAADDWSAKMRSFATLGKSTVLDVDIYFFGLRSNSKEVGRILSNARLFLQPPDILDDCYAYENPHEISFPLIDGLQPPPKLLSAELATQEEPPADMINTVLGNLDRTGSLSIPEVDRAVITTELKMHQKEALDFITNREATQTNESFSLYKPSTDTLDRIYYEHTVIGTRGPDKPAEDFGGIIADEMGLGKTLTMISAITTTKDKGHRFQYDVPSGLRASGSMKKARATLVVCPAVLLMDGWMEEVSKHIIPGFLKCTRFHGASKATEAEILDSDVVLTTYATIISDSSRKNVLHGFHWFRIIIDEAHSIRHQQTRQFRALATLSAKYRWCLTGTPIQNVLNDLGALVRFLRIPQLDGTSDFYHQIAGPIEKRDGRGLRRLQNLLHAICLRRTKDLLELSEPELRIELVQLTEEEKEQYGRIGEEHRLAINRAIQAGNYSDASSGLFRAILRLRMFCSSGLRPAPVETGSNKDQRLSLLEQDDQAICSYCSCDISLVGDYESASSGVLLSCSHLLCADCFGRSGGKRATRIYCSVCTRVSSPLRQQQEPLSVKENEQRYQSRDYNSKLAALVHDIMEHPAEKCIVFSSWKKSVDRVASYLEAHNIPVCVIDGSITLPERRSRILHFQNNAKIPALLMTLGTGAVGLTLTVANRVHILEPQWNPSIEKQAIGRVMRLGQTSRVTVVRYIAEDTVEQHIQSRQEKKLYLAQLGWDDNKTISEEDKFQRLMDMESLLSMKQ